MSDIAFSTLQSRVALYGKLDTSDANVLTAIKAFINDAQEEINGREAWYWTRARTIVQTVADKTAGTVAITAGGTTVVGTDTAFAAGDVGKFIQLGSSNDWYRVTAVASAVSLTIEKPFTSATDATADAYTLRQMYYPLPADVEDVLTIRQSVTPVKLTGMSYRYFDLVDPGSDKTGDPISYYAWFDEATGLWNLGFYPSPDSVMNIEVRYKKRTTDLDADVDEPTMPAKYAKTTLLFGAVWRALAWNRDSSAKEWETRMEMAIAKMQVDTTTRPDNHSMLQNKDTGSRSLEIPLPPDYERNN